MQRWVAVRLKSVSLSQKVPDGQSWEVRQAEEEVMYTGRFAETQRTRKVARTKRVVVRWVRVAMVAVDC